MLQNKRYENRVSETLLKKKIYENRRSEKTEENDKNTEVPKRTQKKRYENRGSETKTEEKSI
jgi:hypothetical protein